MLYKTLKLFACELLFCYLLLSYFVEFDITNTYYSSILVMTTTWAIKQVS